MAAEFSSITHKLNTIDLSQLSVGGRLLVSAQAPSQGASIEMQPYLARKAYALWNPPGAANAMNVFGANAPSSQGGTARNPANTNMFTSLKRNGYSSTGVGGTVGYLFNSAAQWWIGNAAGLGGFTAIFRFGVGDAVLVATANMFAGLINSVAAPTDVAPSTLVNLVGVGCDSGDTHLQLYASGAAAQARTDLGANFPVNTISTDVYELALYCAPNDTKITWQVTRINTGQTTSGQVSGANIPANNIFLAQKIYRSNGGTAAATTVDVMGVYCESDH